MNKTMKSLAVVSVLSLGFVLLSYSLEPMVEHSFPAYEAIKLVGTPSQGPRMSGVGIN